MDNLVSNALFRSLVVRVASAYLGEDGETTHTADMSNGVLPTSQNRQKQTRNPFKSELRKKRKRTKGKDNPRKKRRIDKLRNRNTVKKYEERARANPKKVERKPSGGARSWADYKKDHDWSADHKKRKDTSKSDYEKSEKGKKTRKKYYEKNKNKMKNK